MSDELNPQEQIEQLKFELSKTQTQLSELQSNYNVLAKSEKTYRDGFENQAKTISSLRDTKKEARRLGRVPDEPKPSE